jgi:CubicO group peptidase (beta-lactamase class C family)
MRKAWVIIWILLPALFSCTGNTRQRNVEQERAENPLVIEKLSPAEQAQLAAVFTGGVYEQIDSLMAVYKERFSFNGSVLIGYHGMPAYHKTFGYMDFSEKEPTSKNIPFQLASVSKQFTAISVIMLVEEGVLNYGDTVAHFIPDFPYPRVTVEQLLHHTAGMPNYMWLLEHKWERGKEAYNDDIIYLMKTHETNLYFRPGLRYDYSNTGYAVLAYLVEVVSGMPFPDFVQQRIFDPLEMKNSFVYSRALGREYPERLSGYYRRWRRYNKISETVHDGVVGDKGVYSTAEDLFKWDQALYTNKLISDSSKKRAFTPVKVRSRWEYPYGYGFRLKTVNDKKVVYHTGLWEGFRVNLMRYIEDRNTIIVLNHTNANVNNVMIKRIEHILQNEPEITPTREVVTRILEEGVDKGMLLYLKYKRRGITIDKKKILTAAELLSELQKPGASSALIEVYRQISSEMSVERDFKVSG